MRGRARNAGKRWRDSRSHYRRCGVTRRSSTQPIHSALQALLATLLTTKVAIRAHSVDLPRTTLAPYLARPMAASPRLVLIAERDLAVRDLQKHFLDEAGFAVEFVADGEAALERARAIHPAVIVTEILLPKIDGLTLCRRLRDEPATRDIPVIVFSILAASARAADAGAQAFLRKPLVESVFITAVKDLIGTESGKAMEEQWESQ